MKPYRRTPLARAVSAALTGSVLVAVTTVPAHSQESEEPTTLDEIVVTAQKRTENLQDIALSVQVLGNEQLENLNVDNFGDYIEFLPSVSYQSERPGVSQIYMRGISSGGDGVHSGSMPSVGVYVDEQPVTTINQILDVHIYDIARIETLSGPQGTLFGASSQAGTMRIITNKPVIGEFEGGFDVGASATEEGEPSYSLEGFANLPISDNMAVRLVGWYMDDGGYIDNVPGIINYHGVGEVDDNADLVEEDYNDVSTAGMRALLKIDLNENWTLTPGIMYQEQDSDGVFQHDPEEIGDLQVKQFYADFYDDSWYQASLTLEGNIGDLDLVYAGAYLDRDADGLDDYSHYAQYLDNYYGYYGGCYHYDSTTINCTNPSQYITSDETFTRQSHEIRLQSSPENRFRWIAGLFWQRQEHDFDLRWVVPDMDPVFNPEKLEESEDDPIVQSPLGTVIEGELVVWQTKQIRVDRDKAFFGEVSFDLTDNWTVVGGYRYFDFENSLFGFNGGLSRCLDANDEPQFVCFEHPNLDDVSKGDGDSFKFSLNYSLDEDKLLYATYSEGFRAGGVNRASVPGIAKYEPDFVDNYEVGWKTIWLDGQLRFNGALYQLDWDDFQFSFLDFDVSPLTIIQNIGQARTKGAEFDLAYAATSDLTLSLSGSYTDAKLQEPYWRTADERIAGDPPRAPTGTEMPLVPEFQFTGIGRLHFSAFDLPAFAQAAVSYTGDSWNDLEVALREKQASYTLVNLATGIESDNWSLSLFIDNATDERAEIVRYNADYFDPFDEVFQDTAITVNRPRTIGIRYGRTF